MLCNESPSNPPRGWTCTVDPGDEDLVGSGMVGYENGVVAFLNSRAPRRTWQLEFDCERGRIVSRNAHAWFELWEQDDSETGAAQRQFPFPWRPRSSVVDAIEGVARSIESGVEKTCPGEFGREALEVAVAMRESHRRGGVRVDLPLADRGLRLG